MTSAMGFFWHSSLNETFLVILTGATSSAMFSVFEAIYIGLALTV